MPKSGIFGADPTGRRPRPVAERCAVSQDRDEEPGGNVEHIDEHGLTVEDIEYALAYYDFPSHKSDKASLRSIFDPCIHLGWLGDVSFKEKQFIFGKSHGKRDYLPIFLCRGCTRPVSRQSGRWPVACQLAVEFRRAA